MATGTITSIEKNIHSIGISIEKNMNSIGINIYIYMNSIGIDHSTLIYLFILIGGFNDPLVRFLLRCITYRTKAALGLS